MEKFRTKLTITAVGLALVAAIVIACGDTNIFNQLTTSSSTNPSPSASPSSDGSLPPGSRVIPRQVSQSCPANVTPPTDERQIKVGCMASWVCAVKFQNGNDIPNEVRGPAPSLFAVTAGGERVNVQRPSEPFNLELTGLVPGPFTVTCAVKGTSGLADGTVVGR